jgi:uncharacterized protein YcgI (DUF1989 family)
MIFETGMVVSCMNILQAGHGVAVQIDAGQAVRIVNTTGMQTVDTWAIASMSQDEHLSMEQSRRKLLTIYPTEGDRLFTNRRNAILLIEKDTTVGRHDTLFDCCDEWVYQDYGCPPGHRSCRMNFREALARGRFDRTDAPSPLNLWMNVGVSTDGALNFERPVSKPGDQVVFRALLPVIVVLSACPMDAAGSPVNGGDGLPQDVEWEVVA